MTWHMEMFFTVFWNKKLLDCDFHCSRAYFSISFRYLEERFATPACCVLTWLLSLQWCSKHKNSVFLQRRSQVLVWMTPLGVGL